MTDEVSVFCSPRNVIVVEDFHNGRNVGLFSVSGQWAYQRLQAVWKDCEYLEKQAWFMDNVNVWLLCDSDDSDSPDDFNEEDLLYPGANYRQAYDELRDFSNIISFPAGRVPDTYQI